MSEMTRLRAKLWYKRDSEMRRGVTMLRCQCRFFTKVLHFFHNQAIILKT
jgi:hypothetical protein